MKFTLILLIFVLVACNNNPYPDLKNPRDGIISPIEGEDPKDNEVTPKDPLSLSVPDKMLFDEGLESSYEIKPVVYGGGSPIIDIEGLPKGASFDAQKMTITWRPGYFDGNDPKDPVIKSRDYSIRIHLRSADFTEQRLSRTSILTVSDQARPVEIKGASRASVREGEKLVYKFEVENKDFPKGPFTIFTDGMPANTNLVKKSENKFELHFSPDFFHVNRLEDSSITHNGTITVHNPGNTSSDFKVAITVSDVRLGVEIQTPNTPDSPVLVQGLDASFQIVAYDLNKEVSPKIEFASKAPQFGKFELELVKLEDSFSSVFNVKWLDIPPEYNGSRIDLDFSACVLGSKGRMNNCSKEVLKIAIQVKDRKAPIISRAAWETGELVYLKHNERVTRSLPITDGEDGRLDVAVEIFPKEMRKFVSYADGKLTMQFDQAGTHQFNVKATSPYKTSSTESFIVEVFSLDRSKTLFFADSTRDPEVKFYQQQIKNVSLMNPLIQTIDLRAVSGRETLILGTSVLFDDLAHEQILRAMSKIKNIIIASPLMANMPEKFLNELNEEYSTKFIGRYSDIPTAPVLKLMSFMYTDQFQAPKHRVKLKMISSPESSDPLIFNGGLDNPDKVCKNVLGISPDGNSPYIVGVVCDRTKGGRMVLLGTEWADLATHKDDYLIPALWFSTMLKGKF